MTMFEPPQITVSLPVVFLHQGLLAMHRPAVVDTVHDGGVLDLQVFQKSSPPMLRRSVRHMLDPELAANPTEKGRNGCWVAPREYEKLRADHIERERRAVQERESAQVRLVRERIIRLFEEGQTPTMIAANVGVSVAMVDSVIAEYRCTHAAAEPQATPPATA